jgi:hypothetical protein
MQTPAHAQHAEAIGELIETPAQSVAKGNAAGAQPTVAPTVARPALPAALTRRGRATGLKFAEFFLNRIAAAVEARRYFGHRQAVSSRRGDAIQLCLAPCSTALSQHGSPPGSGPKQASCRCP